MRPQGQETLKVMFNILKLLIGGIATIGLR